MSDAVTVTICLRRVLKKQPTDIQAAIISGPALFQFAASTIGNRVSEVRESLDNLVQTIEYTPPTQS